MDKDQKELKTMSIKDRIKFFQKRGNEEKKVIEENKIKVDNSAVQERIRKMREEQYYKNISKVKENLEYNFNISKKANDINANIKSNKPEPKPKIKEEIKPKIIPGSIKLEEKDNLNIYQYPNINYSGSNSKILLIIGNAQNDFIKTFINVYSNISFNDKERYTIINNYENKEIMFYNIEPKIKEKNYRIKLISIPHLDKDDISLKKSLFELFDKKAPKIHLICFTFNENKIELNEYEKIFYRFFVNLFNLRDKLLFLVSSNQNDINNNQYNIHQFLNSNNYFIGENDNINPEYITINNKIIFENDENNWKNLMEKMQIIKNKITYSKFVEFTKDKIPILDLIFFESSDKFIQKFTKFKKREKIIIIYYLIDLQENLKQDFSKLILGLYNNLIRENQDYINLNDKRISYINEANADKYIHLLSKLSSYFKNIEMITIKNCKIKDFSLNHLEALFSNKLTHLILNNNKISDLSIFNKRQIYSNVKTLDLSYNDISDLTYLSQINFSNLKKLNLIGNNIKSGLEKFLSNVINNTSEKLILEISKKENLIELFFDYSVNFELKFKYIIENKNYNEILKNISFNGIKSMMLKGFDNDIHFLSNKSLQNLNVLDIVSNNINDLSIFDDINFIDIKAINVFSSDDNENSKITPIIEKNFNSLTYFKSIRLKELMIYYNNNKYEFSVFFSNPQINIIFNNIDFLYSDVLLNPNKLNISGNIFDIDGHSTNIFSYETLKSHKLACFRNIYCEKLEINYAKNIYKCQMRFLNPELILSFNFKNLSFFEENNELLTSAKKLFLSNFTLKTLEKYNSLQEIELKNIFINDINVISKIYNIYIKCSNIRCNTNLIDALEEYDFIKKIYNNNIEYQKSYYSNLLFNIRINKDLLNNIKSLKNCTTINLNNSNLDENGILFLNKNYFNSLINLDLSGNEIKNLYFISYDSLVNLKSLNLSNNKIEDINYLIEENIKCKNLINLYLDNNPIRKGLEVLKQKFFTNRFLYIEILEIIKKNDEYLISLFFKDPISNSDIFKMSKDNSTKFGFNGTYIDLYIKDLNNLWNYIDKKNIFFSNSLVLSKIENLFTQEEYELKCATYNILLDLSLCNNKTNLREFNNKLFSDFYIKDNNVALNFFQLLYDKGYNYLKELSNLDKIISFEKIKIYFSFLNINSLYYFQDLSYIVNIDLTGIEIKDIKILCGDVPFTELKTLKICDNPNITNLYELKNAKFVNLKQLYLSKDELSDLSLIEMEKYPFYNLNILDLSYNSISNIEPILHFENLSELNLRNNKIFTEDAIILIQKMSCRIDLIGNYAYYDEIRNNCGNVSRILC